MYIAPKQKVKINWPVKEMRSFDKAELEAGEERVVSVEVKTKYVVSYWDAEWSNGGLGCNSWS